MQKRNISNSLKFEELLNQEISGVDSNYNNQLAELLKINKLKIAVIESVTGGGIARKIVEAPGASNYFLGGMVTYQSRMKIQQGLVNPETIRKHGVISSLVTEEMASGMKKLTQADI